jgi:catechol 2,3-dioxygenase-like lactoylglutathione lyase family enzyme
LTPPSVSGGLVFFYYHNLEPVSKFYGETMGFELKLDRNWVKIYRIGVDSHVGLVDAERGSHRPSPDKPVRLQVMVDDADAWFSYLKSRGVQIDRDAPTVGTILRIKAFSVEDPGGYTVEICEYMSPYGE